jgi:antitoxin YefM
MRMICTGPGGARIPRDHSAGLRAVAIQLGYVPAYALVEEADRTHEIIQITRHGHPSAVLMSADDLESLQETIHWLSQPGIREDLDQARRDIAEGNTVSGDDLRREFGLPPR